jgi:flagellar basal-body rod modification protein FlgD
VNSNLNGINAALTAQNNYQAINLVGKSVVAEGNTFSVSDGESTGVKLTLDESAIVTMYISDSAGSRVRTVEIGALEAGKHDLTWDARDLYGRTVDDGEYRFLLSAENIDGEQVDTLTQIQGVVTGVSFAEGDLPVVMINGIKVSINNIMEIDTKTTATEEE